jgi:septation ring formation regulator EzrA
MLFLQIKLLEAQVTSLRKREIEGRDELSEYRQTAETVRYKLGKNIIQLQEEYLQLDDKFKQVGS